MTHRISVELSRLQRDSHDKCSVCARPFVEADTTHAGYSLDGRPLFVGDCCAAQLVETAARFYWMPLATELPRGDASLWRYMDFSKFVALLRDKALYFARSDRLSDPWEGAKGAKANLQRWEAHYFRFFRDSVKNPPSGYECHLSEEELDKEARRLVHELSEIGESDRRTNYVSCWHENEGESEAFWRLYCPPPSMGVSIRTTCFDLNAALGDDPGIQIGRVRYVDFRTRFAEINEAIFRKRNSLSHEREVRAVVRLESEPEEFGVFRAIDLSTFLRAVVISPFAPPWFESVLLDVMVRYGVNAPLTHSELLLEPFF